MLVWSRGKITIPVEEEEVGVVEVMVKTVESRWIWMVTLGYSQ